MTFTTLLAELYPPRPPVRTARQSAQARQGQFIMQGVFEAARRRRAKNQRLLDEVNTDHGDTEALLEELGR
ncbi:hypothetical protein [Deinococcus peraridilitoris]|uniref:Uncharacterized protein n=1 Tax=Deinococcus peraridilitoris (strain DSM 19664 / LMG 22246 / CIP 109416 / KR-200) TaxID=937777 RepID=K9ZZU0_DEIPD|nr:hypothetical protein [Deinococcus peraridilitoris]AFZ67096.1 hypothetical protein Deipe_1555 [Deinococcus peraridilitoris DSM 19664]